MSFVFSFNSCLASLVSRPLASRVSRLATSFLTVALALSAFAEHQSFERYQTIVDRQMFGPPPEGFDPTKPPSEAKSSRDAEKQAQQLSKEQEKLKSAIHFSMINVTPEGEVAVGFTDKSNAKTPVNYYLKVGESRGGWTVKEADPVASSMTIVKGDIEVSLTIGGDSAKGAGTTSSVAARASAHESNASAGSIGSLRARRLQRRAEQDARMEAERKQIQEQQAALEKQRQEDRQAREAEKAEREAEREEQRAQLLKIQEELKRAREEKEKAKAENANSETANSETEEN